MALGLPKHRVEVHAYDPEWPGLFAEEATRLKQALGNWALAIEHVGSTSVPGLDSKPIIDISIAIEDFDEAFETIPTMAELGYMFRGELGIPRRHFFILGRPRTHHVHMNEATSLDLRWQIAFRDYLRSHPDVAEEYRSLKLRLAGEFPTDLTSYSSGKSEFIANVLHLASSEQDQS